MKANDAIVLQNLPLLGQHEVVQCSERMQDTRCGGKYFGWCCSTRWSEYSERIKTL